MSSTQSEPPHLLRIIWLHAKRKPTVRGRFQGCFKEQQQQHQSKKVCVFFLLVDHVDDSLSEQSSEGEERAQQQLDMRKHCTELFDRAAVHLTRAMVLYTPTHREPYTRISGVPMQIYNVQNTRFPSFTKQIRNALKRE